MSQGDSDDRCIVEHSGEPVGMIVRSESGFVFYAAAAEVWELDHQMFPTMHAAQRAARQAAIEANSRPSRSETK